MTAITTLFWYICTFRGGPESLPANNYLLTIVIVCNGILSFVVSLMLSTAVVELQTTQGVVAEDVPTSISTLALITQVVVGQAGLAGLTWVVLALTGFSERLTQTLCALFGADLLITATAGMATATSFSISPNMVGPLLFLGSLIWTVAAFGHIFHRALNVAIGFGVAAAIFVMLFSMAISNVVIGGV